MLGKQAITEPPEAQLCEYPELENIHLSFMWCVDCKLRKLHRLFPASEN